MFSRCVFASLLAGGAIALPATASAQAWPPPPPPAKNMDRLLPPSRNQTMPEVEELSPSQIERAQEPAATAPVPVPKKAEKPTTSKQSSKPQESTHTIACEGTFARTSSQLRLENVYKAQNVAYTQVEGSGGAKVNATVLFPQDPKRRLEFWWADEEKRRDIYLIVINGESAWAVPRGVRLGLSLAGLEKLNHKPFKITGSQVSDWNGGALARLPGGCKVGVRLRVDSDVAADVREVVAGNKEFASSDATIRAAKPVIAEIMLGY